MSKNSRELNWIDKWLRDNNYPPSAYNNSRYAPSTQMFKDKNKYWANTGASKTGR